jgi:hypothetical protein
MTFFKTVQSKLALGSAAFLTVMSADVSASSGSIEVGTGLTATVASGDLVVGAANSVHKTGAGTLVLSGDHSGAGKIEGNFYVDAGMVQYGHANSFGDKGAILATNAKIQPSSTGIHLAGPLQLADGASVTIDLNDLGDTYLPSFKQAGSTAVTVSFDNATSSNIHLEGAFFKAHDDDKMVVPANATLNVGANVDTQLTVNQLRSFNGPLYYDGTDIANGFYLDNQTQGSITAYNTDDSNTVYVLSNVYYSGAGNGSAYEYSAPKVPGNIDLANGATFKASSDMTLPKITIVSLA